MITVVIALALLCLLIVSEEHVRPAVRRERKRRD
jgi:hypothetical protein